MPADISVNAPSIAFSALGQTQQLVPTVTDQDGQTVNATVTWTSSDNGVATVSSSGLVSAVRGGSAEVTATAGSASASSNVDVNQTPTQLQKISGDGQTAPAGATLTAPLVVQVNDAGGSPIPGRTVSFTVTQGEGSSATATAITGNDGRASTSFTTGTIAGSAQELSVSVATTALTVMFTATAAADHSAFNIGLRYLSTATPAQQQAFTNARLKWESVISADLADVPLVSAAEDCGPSSPAVNQTIDDVLILVRLVPIDGPGNILGGAGPCYVRDPGDPLTVMGVMQFDTDDLEQLETGGFLGDVILHEMGHVLGIGTLWDLQGLLADASLPPGSGTDPHFTGAGAIAAFDDAGGVAYVAGAKVPVEGTGGEGTADSHWRESVLDNELMTGFIGAGQNPLSRITIASLADQGYQVDLAAADDYSILGLLRAFDTRPKLLLKNDILRVPIRKVDRRGRITGELRR
ncbi:MAG: Ig-like domain-containing protein [Gemmatimonadota bacterium]|nr:Ig-like domain-containing protein [Gemmatimonadota bacterium]